jgi:hypothetical protein
MEEPPLFMVNAIVPTSNNAEDREWNFELRTSSIFKAICGWRLFAPNLFGVTGCNVNGWRLSN